MKNSKPRLLAIVGAVELDHQAVDCFATGILGPNAEIIHDF